MYAVLQLRVSITWSALLLFVTAVLALMAVRFYIAYFVLFATLTSFVFSRRGSLPPRLASNGLIGGGLVVAFTFVVPQEAMEEQNSHLTLERLQLTRSDQATQGQ